MSNNVPATPAQHERPAQAARHKEIAEAGRAAAARAPAGSSTEQAVEAALTVAAERAAARDSGNPSSKDIQPVAQHTDAAETTEASEPAATIEPANGSAKPELALRLKQRQRQAAEDLRAAQVKFDQDRRAFDTEKAEVAKAKEREARLAKLRDEDPSAYLAEVGMTDEHLKRHVQGLLAKGRPEGKALAAESAAEKAIREVEALKQQLTQEKQQSEARAAEVRFVEAAKSDDYSVLSALYADQPFSLVEDGYRAQQSFHKQFGRYAYNEEILFNLEVQEATKLARATGNDKLAKAAAEARRLASATTTLAELPKALAPIRAAYQRPKATKDETLATKKPAPGPAAQTRVSQPSGDDAKPLTIKEKRARAIQAGRDAREQAERGEIRLDPRYLGRTR